MHQAVLAHRRNEPGPVGGGFRRVVVYSDSRSVDLVLSAALPIEALIPQIVDVLAAQGGRRAESMATRHQLSLPGDIALDASKSLVQLGIRDGSVLLLTSASTVLTPPRFDDVAEEVCASLASTARPWTRHAARLIAALAAGCLMTTGAAILIGTTSGAGDVGRGGCAGVAAAAGLVALLAALAAHRVFRDGLAGLTFGLAAGGFAALAGWLAVPGELGAPNALFATAAAATSATVMRAIGCCATVFTALACFATVEAGAALLGAVTAVPLVAIGGASAAMSLVLIEVSAPLSIVLTGLSSRVEPWQAAARNNLSANAIRAKTWLTSLVAAFSAAAALGAVVAAAGSLSADGPRWPGLAFATTTGGVLLLRARSHRDLARSVSLVAGGIVTLSAALVITAVAYPLQAPYLAAASTILAAAALCLGFITQTTLSPLGRRSVELLEYLALAIVVPLACWICGLYSAARGMNLL